MTLTPEQRDSVVAELKHFSTELNLSDDQKDRLKTILSEGHEKLEKYKQENPNPSKAELTKKITDNRDSIRERVVSFLTPDQLRKWDAAIAKAKDFLGQKAASA